MKTWYLFDHSPSPLSMILCLFDKSLHVGFGILFATVITLVLVPSLYLILQDVAGLFLTDGRADDSRKDSVELR